MKTVISYVFMMAVLGDSQETVFFVDRFEGSTKARLNYSPNVIDFRGVEDIALDINAGLVHFLKKRENGQYTPFASRPISDILEIGYETIEEAAA